MNDELIKAVSDTDWECAEADTRYLTHGIHRYSGKFIPQLARRAIEIVSPPAGVVVDPYSGSGTTLLEAALTGRHAIGFDVNPLATLISSVKTTPVDIGVLHATVNRLISDIDLWRQGSQPALRTDQQLQELIDSDHRRSDPWYVKWFQPEILSELIGLHTLIESIEDVPIRNLGLVVFSDLLRASSNAHSSYPNVMYDKRLPRKTLPSQRFATRLREIANAVEELTRTLAPELRPSVINGDARCIPLGDEKVDAVVTHPPYIASIPYAEYGQLSLKWLGHEPGVLDRRLTGGVRRAPDVVERFERDYRQMLQEVARILRPGGRAFLLVGAPLVRGERIDLAEMTCALASSAGLKLDAVAFRQGVNRRANLMGKESLLFFTKP